MDWLIEVFGVARQYNIYQFAPFCQGRESAIAVEDSREYRQQQLQDYTMNKHKHAMTNNGYALLA